MGNRPTQSAFTIIELLVAMSVAVLLGFLINTLFFETTNAVSRGIATSRIISSSRTFGEQIDRDADRTVRPFLAASLPPVSGGPGGGVLVILGKEYANVNMVDPRYGGVISRPANVRSDQLTLIYNNSAATGDPIEPLCGASQLVFSNSTSDSPFVRIWYGHVLKTLSDGSDPTFADLGDNLPTAGDYPNRWGHHWVLGRQALFMHEGGDSVTPIPPSTIHANGIFSSAPVTGYTTDILVPAASRVLHQGLTDIAYFSYFDTTKLGASANGVVVGTGSALLNDGDADGTYKSVAYRNLTYAVERLRCNPVPSGATFYTSQIAQMHPYFISGVSDFIVEFAADAVDAGGDGLSDGGPDTNANGVIWYGVGNLPPWDAAFIAAGAGVSPTDANPAATYAASGLPGSIKNADVAFVFRHDDLVNWPYLLRIRYHLHDPKGELTGINDDLLSNSLDDNFNNVADDGDEAHDNGKWFEVILKVNRS